ncbi:MAG: hypothetical protein LBP64_08610 [Tannerella sp.]|jgi:hypothetical protein|nr:hypothetical protein [Tannerella sp.]
MKKWLIIIFAVWFRCFSVPATDNLRLPDVGTLGMGGNGGAHSAFFNPSLLGMQTKKTVRVDYYSRYSLKELATISSGFCFPNRVLPVGLHVASFGYDEYRESLFRLSAGKQLNASWALGISVQYTVMQSEIFESDVARISTDIGVTFRPSENLSAGVSVINFPSVPLNEAGVDSRRIGAYLAELNVNWNMTNEARITSGIAHCEETPFSASFGTEYLISDDFRLRAGVRTTPLRPSLGMSFRLNNIEVDTVMIYHSILGANLGMGLSLLF